MRILLIGKTGQLGWELERTLLPLGEVIAFDYPVVNLSDPATYQHLVDQTQPGLVVNAAAYTAVDKAESEPALATAINTTAPGVLAEAALKAGAAFIHFSTDYVFDGLKGSPYLESDSPNPLNTYGRTKLQGELAIQQVGGAFLVLRTSWVYSMRQGSAVGKILKWSREQPELKLVTDQVGNPTWARMLAEVTSHLVASASSDLLDWFTEHRGVYHLAGSGYCSRYEWGQEILRLDSHKEQQVARQIVPAQTVDFPTPAQRPLFSALNCDLFNKTFHLQLPDWKPTLKLAMESA